MFTGLIDKRGAVLFNQSKTFMNRLSIRASFEDLQVGESIAVNGVCLTLLPDTSESELLFDVSPETLNLTTLMHLRAGDEVNLERALLSSTRYGGHYVSGHVDTTASLMEIKHIGDCVEMTVGGFSREDMRFLLPKGSITLDGVSLTINQVKERSVVMMLVPHTLAITTLGGLSVGQCVNVEFDYLARVVAHQLAFLDISAIKELTR